MGSVTIPERVLNWIDGAKRTSEDEEWFDKRDPVNGRVLCKSVRSRAVDVRVAVAAAKRAQPAWAAAAGVQRGMALHRVVTAMEARREEIAGTVAAETGKSMKDALAETGGAIQLGLFYASEGQRLYGRTTTSGVAGRWAMTIREPIGVAGLIAAANTPIANVAWKAFPALVCGNTVVMKPAEDTPATAYLFARICDEAGLPPGVFNIVQGYGEESGLPLVEHPDVGVVSFTGSTMVGRRIAHAVSGRLARVSLELGGKNAFVVCDDADMDNAVKWAALSAFSNAGQRCAAASRIIVTDGLYDDFRARFVDRARQQRLGPGDDDDFGPVISARQLENMLNMLSRAVAGSARVLCGGRRSTDANHGAGYYMEATVVEGAAADAEISRVELFGPVVCLYRVADLEAAIALCNDSEYGLTACIHTRSIERALRFTRQAQVGVVFVNAGTYGSEPHMPFGGLRQSGNGSREPGTEALDVYSEIKNVYLHVQP